VAEIIFFGARRGECHLSGKIDGVIVHWRSIAVEACKQSGNPFLPSISHCKNLGAIDLHRFSTKIFGGLSPRAIPLRKALETASIGTEICVAIGPEGDFSAEEYAHLAESGFVECRFARHVLRSEVAASMAVGLVAHLAEG
jgi:16S rRNA (uracil1498-N3)-methyltransferase